jgi:hypothetical protein
MDPHDPKTQTREPLSRVLQDLCDEDPDTPLTMGQIVERFGRRAFGALLFFFAIPNALPLPPGSSSILGLPILLFAPQVMLGFRRPWLPRFFYERHVKPHDLQKLFSQIIPRLQAVEKVSKPRLTFLFGPIGDRIIGVVCLLLGIVLIFPIPLGNLAPAICIGALGLGLFQRDGLIALVGYGVFLISVALLVVSANVVIAAVQKMITMLGF